MCTIFLSLSLSIYIYIERERETYIYIHNTNQYTHINVHRVLVPPNAVLADRTSERRPCTNPPLLCRPPLIGDYNNTVDVYTCMYIYI